MHKTMILLLVAGLLSGCATLKSMFDWNGDGEVNPITYLQDADIQVAWVDAEGNAYQMDLLELGEVALYTYVEQKTGYRFELAEQQDGSVGIKIRDPDGYEVYIVPAPIAYEGG